MPTLRSSDNSVEIAVKSTSDQTGINETKEGLEGLGDTGKEVQGKVNSFTENFQDGMKKISVVTGVVGAGLAVYAKSSVSYLSELVGESKNLARQTGMTAEESSKLIAAMSRLGLDAQTASGSLKIFSRNIQEARESTKAHETALGKLSVSTQDAEGKNKDFNQILLEVADRFKEMPDGPQKTAAALDLFGRSGTNMIKVLNGGSKAITDLAQEAERLGLTLNSSNIGAVSDYIKSQKELEATSNSLKIAVGTLTAPLLTTFNTKLNEVAQSLIGVDSPLRDVVASVLAFGGPILGATSAVTGFLGGVSDSLPLLSKFSTAVGGVGKAFGWVAIVLAVIGALIWLEQETHFFTEALEALQPILQEVGVFMDTYLRPVFEVMIGTIGFLIREGIEKLREAYEKLKPWLQEHEAELRLIGTAILIGVIAPLVLLVAAIGAAAIAIITAVNLILDAFNWMISTAMSVWDGLNRFFLGVVIGVINMRNNVVNMVGEIAAFMSNLPGRILAAVGNLGNLLWNAGRDLIQGLINGVGSMFTNAVNSVKNLGNNIAQSLRDKLGIRSPSVVFEAIGKFTGEGLVNGLESMAGKVNSAVNGLIDPSMMGTPATAAATITENIYTNPGAPVKSGPSSVYYFGDVHLHGADAVKEFFDEDDRDIRLTAMGMSPARGQS